MSAAVGRSRRTLTALACVILASTLVGCTGEWDRVCTAIGYIDSLSVELTGDASQVVEVRLCDVDGECSHLAGGTQPVEASPSPRDNGVSPTASPAQIVDELSLYTASGSDNSWSFRIFNKPESGTITAYYADGSVAAEATADFEWKQVGGTTECGGPAEAGPIVIALN